MKGNRGFVKMVVFIVVLLIILGFFGYNLKDIINSPAVKENFVTVWGWIVHAWTWVVETVKGFLPNS